MSRGKYSQATRSPYEGLPIQQGETDARLLTTAQTYRLIMWYGMQRHDLSEGVPIQQLLDLWHASLPHDSLDQWSKKDRAGFVTAYNRCIEDTSRHLRIED